MRLKSLSGMEKNCSLYIFFLGAFWTMSFFTVISQTMKFSWRKITNETSSLLIQPWQFKHAIEFWKPEFFIHLMDTALSVDRLITTWLSTCSSKWKVWEYLAVMANVNRVGQRDLKHIMYKFFISYYNLFTLLVWTAGIVMVFSLCCLDQYSLQNSSLLSVLANFDKVQIFIWPKWSRAEWFFLYNFCLEMELLSRSKVKLE